jgi:hypothetical protein
MTRRRKLPSFWKETTKRRNWRRVRKVKFIFALLSVILKVSMFLVCSVIRNLLLGIVPKQSVILFLEGAADSSDASTASAAVLVQSCNDPKVEEVVVFMEEQSTKPHEGERHSQILSFVPCIVVCSY